jgi:hypothetical protein
LITDLLPKAKVKNNSLQLSDSLIEMFGNSEFNDSIAMEAMEVVGKVESENQPDPDQVKEETPKPSIPDKVIAELLRRNSPTWSKININRKHSCRFQQRFLKLSGGFTTSF